MNRKIIVSLWSLFFLLSASPSFSAAANKIENGKKIKIHYTLKVDGKILESTMKDKPVEYVQGEKNIIPALQKGLAGLKAGEHREVIIKPEEGFGLINPNGFKEVPKSQMPKGDLKVGTLLAAKAKNGQTVNAVVKEIKEKTVILDFNHPLAGKELHFEVEVVAIS